MDKTRCRFRRALAAAILAILAALFLSACTLASDLFIQIKELVHIPGSLDTTFGGGDGIVNTNFLSNSQDKGRAMAVMSDGKILLAGATYNGVNWIIALARYNSDGSLDTSFGGGDGMITQTVGTSASFANSMAVQSDGGILLAASAEFGAPSEFVLLRFTPVGSLDTTFGGGDGIARTAIGSNGDEAYAVAVQAGGKILLAGETDTGSSWDLALVRYTTDGLLDTSFGGGDGIVTTAIGAGATGGAIAVLKDGKILVAGQASITGIDGDFALLRFTSDGVLDTSFGGGDGIVTTDMATDNDLGRSIAVQGNGKILVAGQSDNTVDDDFALVRYTADGTVDTSFGGGDGIVTTNVAASTDYGYSVALREDGNILVAGTSRSGLTYHFALLCYNPDGSLDAGFGGGDGIAVTPLGTSSSFCESMALQADGKIVLGGTLYNGTSDDFALVRYWP